MPDASAQPIAAGLSEKTSVKNVKQIGIGLGVGAVLLVGGFVGLQYSSGSSILSSTMEVADYPFAAPADAASITEGKRLLKARGCTTCHGELLDGKFEDMGPMGSIYSPNLTTSDYTLAEVEKVIRHGIKKDGTPAILMPSEDYWIMSDKDLGMIWAAVEAAPDITKPNEESELGFMTYMLLGMGKFKVAAHKIDHAAKRGAAPVAGATAEYGEYIANTCVGCHGQDLKGGIEQGPPGTAPSSDLTSALKGWSREDLRTALVDGKRPDGTYLDAFMPKAAFAHLTEVEIDALYAFLSGLPGNK